MGVLIRPRRAEYILARHAEFPTPRLEIRTVRGATRLPLRVRAQRRVDLAAGLKAQAQPELRHGLAEIKKQAAERVAWDLAGMVETG